MAAITTDTVVRRDLTVVRDESFVEETVKQPTDTEELSELEKNIRKAERIRYVTDQYAPPCLSNQLPASVRQPPPNLSSSDSPLHAAVTSSCCVDSPRHQS